MSQQLTRDARARLHFAIVGQLLLALWALSQLEWKQVFAAPTVEPWYYIVRPADYLIGAVRRK